MSRSIGIDLGTTNTAVAVVVDGRPRVLEDEKGYKVLPSCVASRGEGRYVIGQAAKNLVLSQPENTVYAIKRLMGRRWDSEEVRQAQRRVGYALEPADDGGIRLRLGGETFSPQEVSSIILRVAGQIAERALGESVEEAVVTVPAYFTHAQREATLEAARMAGLRCDRLLNEPTAAALAFGYRKDLDRQLLIFDLGGGTFDVCVLRITGGVYEILATRGDSFLGGEDFDYRLVDHMADHFQAQHGVDLRHDRITLQRLKDAAERAKCELSFTDRTTVLVPRVIEDASLEMVISRSTLEALVEDLVGRTLDTTQATISDAGLSLGQIDDVILVGGQTRMPKIRQAIASSFGKEPNRSVHPEEVVAIGAAVHAASLGDATSARPVLLDVTPFTLGIDSVGGMFAPVIPRNTKIPASRTRVFSTVNDNQDRVRVTVRQGDDPRAESNEFLGEFVMDGLTPMPRMEAKVKVTFRLDANGMLHVQSTEAATGERKQISIRNYAEVARSRDGAGSRGPRPEVEGDGVAVRGAAAPSVPQPAVASPTIVPGPSAGGRKAGLASLISRFLGKPATPAEPAPVAATAAAPGVKDIQLVGRVEAEAAEVPPAPDLAAAAGPADSGIRIDLPAMQTGDEAMLLPMDEEDEELDDYGVEGLFGQDLPTPATVGLAGEGLVDGHPEGGSRGAGRAADQEPAPDGPFGSLGLDDMLALPADDEPMDSLPEPEPMAPEFLRPQAVSPGAPRAPTLVPPEAPSRPPARLKMNYRSLEAFLREYRENLRRGGTFIRTPKPLPVGRECVFEIRAPGIEDVLTFPGVVTWSSTGAPSNGHGQDPGMDIEYRMDDVTRRDIEATLVRLGRV